MHVYWTPCIENLNGTATQTATGPFFIIAGENSHCLHASITA